jgi:hypothetical protein
MRWSVRKHFSFLAKVSEPHVGDDVAPREPICVGNAVVVLDGNPEPLAEELIKTGHNSLSVHRTWTHHSSLGADVRLCLDAQGEDFVSRPYRLGEGWVHCWSNLRRKSFFEVGLTLREEAHVLGVGHQGNGVPENAL